jgi:tRNA/rRNA methyltransferase
VAGTDSTRKARLGGPAVVLVDPQLGENIGAAARAMLNCGLTDLRLVRPRDGWPNDKAAASASGADSVIEGARLFDTTADAIADLRRVYAATARQRDMVQPVTTPRQAAGEMRDAMARDERCGVLFGPERSGLVNDDVALADTMLAVPLNPAYASLNLAQAVLLVGYEWYQAVDTTPGRFLAAGDDAPAAKAELIGLFEHLERELDACGFLRNEEMRPTIVRNIRNLFQRAGLIDQEVRTLRGIITCLTERRGRE